MGREGGGGREREREGGGRKWERHKGTKNKQKTLVCRPPPTQKLDWDSTCPDDKRETNTNGMKINNKPYNTLIAQRRAILLNTVGYEGQDSAPSLINKTHFPFVVVHSTQRNSNTDATMMTHATCASTLGFGCDAIRHVVVCCLSVR